MAIGQDSLVEFVVGQTLNSQQVLNVYRYQITSYVAGTSLVLLTEAWWNHVKTAYRNLIPTVFVNYFTTIKARELNNPAGDYAEFDVPAAERTGLRNVGTATDFAPIFVALGVRFVVGTRVTRPGQKRWACLTENDIGSSGALNGNPTGAAGTLATNLCNDALLGIPAELNTISPRICRLDASGFVTASQKPTGFLINPYPTSQNTRKPGRGA